MPTKGKCYWETRGLEWVYFCGDQEIINIQQMGTIDERYSAMMQGNEGVLTGLLRKDVIGLLQSHQIPVHPYFALPLVV